MLIFCSTGCFRCGENRCRFGLTLYLLFSVSHLRDSASLAEVLIYLPRRVFYGSVSKAARCFLFVTLLCWLGNGRCGFHINKGMEKNI
jgi:hypothetical protein